MSSVDNSTQTEPTENGRHAVPNEAVAEGLAAGAMLTMIAQTMMPEAFEQGGDVEELVVLKICRASRVHVVASRGQALQTTQKRLRRAR